MNILFLDVETTGTDETRHSIIELAAKLHVDGVEKASFHRKSTTYNQKVDMGALAVNGLKIQDIVGHEGSPKVAYDFADFLVSLRKLKGEGQIHICGQNVHFDVRFLKNFLAVHSVEGFESMVSYKNIDLASISLALKDSGVIKGNTSMAEVAKELGIDYSNLKLHTAMDDVQLTIQIYYKIQQLLRGSSGKA